MNRSKIRPPRRLRLAEGSTQDFNQLWQYLATAFTQIQTKDISHLLYEQLHRRAYLLVIQKLGGQLYDKVSALILDHLVERRKHVLQLEPTRGEEFVKQVLNEWDHHLQAMRYISDILMYLDRNYAKENKRLLIYDLGIQLFKTHFIAFNNHEVGHRVIEVAVDEIIKSRQGQVITLTVLITRSIAMMELFVETLGSELIYTEETYYINEFEPQLLARTETFLYGLSLKYAQANDGTTYVEEISRFIREEDARVMSYLPIRTGTRTKLESLMNNVLINDQIDTQMNLPGEAGGLPHLLEAIAAVVIKPGSTIVNYGYFGLLFQLFLRVCDDYKLLCMRLRDAIGDLGFKLMEVCKELAGADGKKLLASAYAVKWVEMVLRLRVELLKLWEKSFDRNQHLEIALTEAIKDVVNRTPKKAVTSLAPETLSVYIDHHIKQSQKQATTAGGTAFQEMVDNFVKFLGYIRDRDAFEVHYANHFAKRFLNSKLGALAAIEEMVLAKLAEEMGVSSLNKVVKMNVDIKSSRDFSEEWKHTQPAVDLEVKICNAQDWPQLMTKDYQQLTVIWPLAIRQLLRQFEEFWRQEGKRNENKSLHWTAKFGSVDMRITYPLRTYEFNLATYAAIIMLLFAPQSSDDEGVPVLAFDEARELTFHEIKELTGIPDSDLRRHLQLIAVAPRLRLLVKVPMTKDVRDDDKFRLNSGFKLPSVKVKVLTVLGSSSLLSKKELAEVDRAIVEGRKLEVNAAIVRVMKSRRLVKHNELLADLIKLLTLRFRPQVVMVKQQIEDLIEREYIKRDEEDRNMYHYLA